MVIAVIGPTASGKTSLAIELAKKYDGEIICCDSMQVYKHMKIGTASPTEEEISQASHHLFNFIEPTENYNAALYQKVARKIIDDILRRDKLPILCGGTGLYAKAALYNMNFSAASTDEAYRKKLEDLLEKDGAEVLHNILKEKDPVSATTIHKNNAKRVIRALEILHLSGIKKSDQKQEERKCYTNSHIIALNHVRKTLYNRINMRVDLMIEEGLEDEVRNLLDIGVSKENNALQAIGYKEWIDYFEDNITFEECIYNIKINSRHYAKRQLTWFNRMNVKWYDYNESVFNNFENVFESIFK